MKNFSLNFDILKLLSDMQGNSYLSSVLEGIMCYNINKGTDGSLWIFGYRFKKRWKPVNIHLIRLE